jgi:hypothetical protein
MAAPTTTISGVDLLLKIGGNTLTQRDAELTYTVELPDVSSKSSANFAENINGVRDYSFRFNGLYVESSAELAGRTGSISFGGTALKGWESATMTLSAEMPQIVNFTDGLDTKRNPKMRRVGLSVGGYYFDSRGTGATALDTFEDELFATNTAGFTTVVTFGAAQSFTFTARPTSYSVRAPMGDEVRNDIVLASTGAPTIVTTGAETALAALITAWKATNVSTSVTALFATATSGASQWTATCYVSELTIEIPYKEEIRVSGTLSGSGAIVPAATS